ncbi:hypothetical protein TcYC6_0115040 [Trypanosoma cruzi]|nr:hypothetical protein TcYC6_0115040 [Trypanosoma cruzi]
MNLCFEAYFRSCHLANFGKLYHDGFRRPNSSKGVALFKDGGAKIIIRVSRDKKLRLWKHFACGDSSESREVDFFSGQKFIYIWSSQYSLPLPLRQEAHKACCEGVVHQGFIFLIVAVDISSIKACNVSRFAFHTVEHLVEKKSLRGNAYSSIYAA